MFLQRIQRDILVCILFRLIYPFLLKFIDTNIILETSEMAQDRRENNSPDYEQEYRQLPGLRLFSQAEMIVTSHGSGVVNLIFCEKPPRLIGLFGHKVSHFMYTLARGLGCDYSSLMCAARGEDIVVDCDRLKRLLVDRLASTL